jgi:catechol 2,3-dioxygenase
MNTVSDTTAAKFSPRRLGHANIQVSDLNRSQRFYNDVLGIELVCLEPGIGAAFHSNGNSHHDVALMQCTQKPLIGIGGHVQAAAGTVQRPGLNHFGWEVDNEAEVAAAWKRAVATGVPIDTTSNHQVAHSVYLYDPDGNYHEFYADIIEDWRTVFNLQNRELLTSLWNPMSEDLTRKRYWTEPENVTVVRDAVFHPRRTARAILVAKDYEAMKRFFLDVAGMTPVNDIGSKDYILFQGTSEKDGWHLALFAPRYHLTPGMHHVIFEMPDENKLREAEEKARRAGIETEMIVDRADKRSVFVRDPDSLLMEFRHDRPGAAPSTRNVPPELLVYYV